MPGSTITPSPGNAVFAPLGMASAVLEPDASGVFVGSSFMYATARDWAKLGQLYLRDGATREGLRVLPKGWAAFAAAPAAASDRQYGAHFWLNLAGENGRPAFIRGVPEDAYMMSGHEGQYVLIIPSANAVLVRLGQTRGRPAIDVSAPVFAALYAAIADAPTAAP